MILAKVLSKIYKKDGIILEDSTGQNIFVEIQEKIIQLPLNY